MVGLTIVAFGTSSPELFASVKAALSQQGDIAVGNVVGSNSFNIGVILALAALVCPIPVHKQIIKINAPIALVVALLLPFLLWNHTLGRVQGLLLITGIVAYASMNVVLARRAAIAGTENLTDAQVLAVSRHWGMDIAYILVGFGLLVFGSSLLVDNSVEVHVEERHDLLFVQLGVEAEVVLVDALGRGQTGGLHGGLKAALLLERHFFLQQLVEEGQIGSFVDLGLPGDVLEDLADAVEVQAG
jgi:Ca2+/Na+ antiporter